MKKVLLPLLLMATQSMAAPMIQCPLAKQIKQGGIKEIIHIAGTTYMAKQISNFGTKKDWVFLTGQFYSNSRQEAFAYAMNALETISGNPLPIYNLQTKNWECWYVMMSNKLTGTALTS